LAAGTAISAIGLYMAGVTAFAPRHEALQEAQVERVTAEQNDAAFQAKYKAANEAVAAAQKLVNEDTARASGASGDYAKARICDSRGRNCHGGQKLAGNMEDAKAKSDADRKALANAKAELAKLDPSITAKAVQAKEATLRSAEREDLFSRMAAELIGDGISPTVMMWVRRSVAMMCLFAAMAGSLFAFCPVKAPAKSPVRRDSIESPDAATAAAWPQLLKATEEILAPAVQAVVEAKRAEAGKADAPAPPPQPQEPAAVAAAVQPEIKKPPRRVRRAALAKTKPPKNGATATSPWSGLRGEAAGVSPEPASKNDAVVTPFPQKRRNEGEST
jgi:hypothetical protein